MINKATKLLIAIVASMLLASSVYADAANDIMAKCKKEAAEASVSADNLEEYLQECKADYGADTASSQGAVNEMTPSTMEEGSAAPAAPEESDSSAQ